MYARWDLKTVEIGYDITYQNLWEESLLACGETDMGENELLNWLLGEGGVYGQEGGVSEVVFVDGVYAALLMRPITESFKAPVLMSRQPEGRV